MSSFTVTTLSVMRHSGNKKGKKLTYANQVDVALTATLNGNNISIDGPTGPFPELGVDTGAWHFHFTLDDNTGKNVEFTTLDSADGCAQCPASAGNNSKLITGVRVEAPDPVKGEPPKAHFVDNNNNKAKDGVVNVGFQWNFKCSDSTLTVGTYDPVVPNGGKS
ncbi:MAG TPA: hypothetical protein VGE68_09335 [Sphingomicrobium sp.]